MRIDEYPTTDYGAIAVQLKHDLELLTQQFIYASLGYVLTSGVTADARGWNSASAQTAIASHKMAGRHLELHRRGGMTDPRRRANQLSLALIAYDLCVESLQACEWEAHGLPDHRMNDQHSENQLVMQIP